MSKPKVLSGKHQEWLDMLPDEAREPNVLEDYLFDLQGFLVLKNALSPEEVRACNETIDSIPPIEPGEWHGNVHRQNHHPKNGINYQQIYEAGPAFERLIDHPSWIRYIVRYVGGAGTFDWVHGPAFIDENFANLRGPGEAIGLHSGGHRGVIRTLYSCRDGEFHCGQVNILVALRDIGPGDGATMVIPGSHKSNLEHPRFREQEQYGIGSVDQTEGAIEVHLNAGDAILFVDSIAHGSAERKNSGQRRICVYRYGPSWGNFRFGYQPSAELLERLTPLQRMIVQPQTSIPRQV
jgi:hypothetical protein